MVFGHFGKKIDLVQICTSERPSHVDDITERISEIGAQTAAYGPKLGRAGSRVAQFSIARNAVNLGRILKIFAAM